MKTQTPLKKKRYEVQQYHYVNMAWYPVYHTDDPAVAMRRLTSAVKKSIHARIIDRVTSARVEVGKPVK